MFTLFIVLHVIFCIFLILVILLQTGKGAGIGAAFGGGSQTVFGPRGAGSFIGKVTGTVAALFMITSIILAYLSTSGTSGVEERARALVEERAKDVNTVSLDEETPPSDNAEDKSDVNVDAGVEKIDAEKADDPADVEKADKEEGVETAAEEDEGVKPMTPPGLEKPAPKAKPAAAKPKPAAKKTKPAAASEVETKTAEKPATPAEKPAEAPKASEAEKTPAVPTE